MFKRFLNIFGQQIKHFLNTHVVVNRFLDTEAIWVCKQWQSVQNRVFWFYRFVEPF